METIGDRIALLIKKRGLKKVQFAARLGIDQSYVTQLIKGNKGKPSSSLVKLIAYEFHVRENWLLTGEEPMESSESEDELSACLKKWGLPDEFRGLFLAYKELSDNDQKSVRLFVRKFAEKVLQQTGNAPSVSEPENVHYWTREQMDAEYKRQMDGEETDREKGTTQTSGSGLGNSVTAIA